MNANRKTAIVAGVFYLLTFVSIPTLVLYVPVHNPNYIVGKAPDTAVIIGGLLEIIVALSTITPRQVSMRLRGISSTFPLIIREIARFAFSREGWILGRYKEKLSDIYWSLIRKNRTRLGIFQCRVYGV